MPELMYFYIVRSGRDGEARVIREFVDVPLETPSPPSGTLCEIHREMDIGDLAAWYKVNEELEDRARELGIHTLHNLHPPDNMEKIVKIGNMLRERARSTE